MLAGTGTLLVIAIAAILLTTFFREGQALDTLAVLPLENISGDEEQDALADGVTGELISNFSRLDGFEKVISRSAAMRYKGSDKSPREIADELKVKVLVGGMIQIHGDNVRITAELIDAGTEDVIWSDTFESPRRDILALQAEIATTVVDEINVDISQEERERLQVRRPVDPEAYKTYLKAHDTAQIWSHERFPKALELYERAIELDSTFALPYAELAEMKAAGIAGPYQDLERAEALAAKALELDPNSSQAHLALASIKVNRDWDWEGGLREVREAERLGLAVSAGNLPWHFYQLAGYADKAIEYAIKDLERDPLNPERYFEVSFVYHNANRPDDMIETCRKVLIEFADDEERVREAWQEIARAYWQKGIPDSTLAIAERWNMDTSTDGKWEGEGWDAVYRDIGQPERVMERVKWLEKYVAESGADPDAPDDNTFRMAAYSFATIYCRAGDKEKALAWLERGVRMRSPWMLYLNTEIGDGDFDCLLGDPRFDDIIDRVGIPQSYVSLRLPSVQKNAAD